jgi:hypothetical protein
LDYISCVAGELASVAKLRLFLTLTMQRFTARLVVLLAMLGVCQPFLQTLYGSPPHACCLRRLHAQQNNGPQLGQVENRSGNCCPPLTTPRSAALVAADDAGVQLHISQLNPSLPRSFHAAHFRSSHSSRAPPDSPNA